MTYGDDPGWDKDPRMVAIERENAEWSEPDDGFTLWSTSETFTLPPDMEWPGGANFVTITMDREADSDFDGLAEFIRKGNLIDTRCGTYSLNDGPGAVAAALRCGDYVRCTGCHQWVYDERAWDPVHRTKTALWVTVASGDDGGTYDLCDGEDKAHTPTRKA
jgi:hypothetical protein